jgi:hypothetical protein
MGLFHYRLDVSALLTTEEVFSIYRTTAVLVVARELPHGFPLMLAWEAEEKQEVDD